jgi:predicted xylose isomerase-like sugar epimerase
MSEKTASDELKDALKQEEELQAKIKALREQTREQDLAKVKELIEAHGFTQTDLRSVLKAKRVGARATPRKSTRRKSK